MGRIRGGFFGFGWDSRPYTICRGLLFLAVWILSTFNTRHPASSAPRLRLHLHYCRFLLLSSLSLSLSLVRASLPGCLTDLAQCSVFLSPLSIPLSFSNQILSPWPPIDLCDSVVNQFSEDSSWILVTDYEILSIELCYLQSIFWGFNFLLMLPS